MVVPSRPTRRVSYVCRRFTPRRGLQNARQRVSPAFLSLRTEHMQIRSRSVPQTGVLPTPVPLLCRPPPPPWWRARFRCPATNGGVRLQSAVGQRCVKKWRSHGRRSVIRLGECKVTRHATADTGEVQMRSKWCSKEASTLRSGMWSSHLIGTSPRTHGSCSREFESERHAVVVFAGHPKAEAYLVRIPEMAEKTDARGVAVLHGIPAHEDSMLSRDAYEWSRRQQHRKFRLGSKSKANGSRSMIAWLGDTAMCRIAKAVVFDDARRGAAAKTICRCWSRNAVDTQKIRPQRARCV